MALRALRLRPLRRAIAAILAALLAVEGAGCVSIDAIEQKPATCVRDGTGTVEVDLVGIRKKRGERPEGVEVRLRRVEAKHGPQDMYVLTEKDGPSRLERLPAGRYEVEVKGRRLGAPDLRRAFTLEEDATVRIVLHDHRHCVKKDLEKGLEETGEFLAEAGEVALEVLVVTGIVALYVGVAVLEACSCACR